MDLRLALSLVIIGLLELVHGLSVFVLLLSESSSEFLVLLVYGFDCVLVEMLLLKSELGRVVLFELRDLLLQLSDLTILKVLKHFHLLTL